MRLSKTSAHAALAMAFLAEHHQQGVLQARQVAEHLHIPTDSALKVLQNLARRGLIHSQLGRNGGYRMHRPAEEITLLAVIEAVDGPIESDVGLDGSERDGAGGAALLRSVCGQITKKMREELAGVTVADLTRAQHSRTRTPPV